MVILLFCGGVTLFSACVATVVLDLRKAILALWITGLGVGGLYLSLGAELLAVLQWLISTMMAIAFVFYAAMFGEYGVGDSWFNSRWFTRLAVAAAVGLAFSWMLWLGLSHLPNIPQGALGFMAEIDISPAIQQDLNELGRSLTEDHLLSLEALGLIGFLVIIGAGVIARPEKRDS